MKWSGCRKCAWPWPSVPPRPGTFFAGWRRPKPSSSPRRARIWESAWPEPSPGASQPVLAPYCSGAATSLTFRPRWCRRRSRGWRPGQAQVVLGPATDGGYHLVGLTEPHPALFQGPAWSSRTVLTDTLRLARQLGLRVHLLPPWPDIDTYDDLRTFLKRPRPAPQPGWRSREQAQRLLSQLPANLPSNR